MLGEGWAGGWVRGEGGQGGAVRTQGRKSHYLRLLPPPYTQSHTPAASPCPQSLPLSADLDRKRRHLHSIRAAEGVCVCVYVSLTVCVYLSYLCHNIYPPRTPPILNEALGFLMKISVHSCSCHPVIDVYIKSVFLRLLKVNTH